MSNSSTFRTWLRRRRQERGLTQDALGELVGYAGQTITKIEGGQRRPSPQLALRLAEALQLPLDEHPAWMVAALAGDEAEPPGAESPAPARPLPVVEIAPPPQALPAYLTPFVGRERELAELAALLARPDCRLVTVLGPGGVGKTRLAVEAGRAAQGFPDGAAFVSLAPLDSPAAIAPAIGDALGCAFSAAGDLLAQLIAHLRERRALLILDNLEHLLDPDGVTLGVLERLLAQAPGVVVLATSRERLRLAGEWLLELEGLPSPDPRAVRQPAAAPALALFAGHAERVDRAFRLTPENAPTVTAICRLVDGLPLGIELAAGWLRLLPLEEIAQELTRGLDAAAVSPRSLPARHHSLRAVVDHSWQLLNADERSALRGLAVFRGGFTREAAAQVAGASLTLLAGLVDKSLLRRGAGGRYELHEIIRQYADAQLRERPDELAQARDRHAAFFLRLAAEREWRIKGADQLAAVAELSAEIDNIRAAWPYAAAHGPLELLEGAGETLHWFYEFRSWLQEGADHFAQAVELLRASAADTPDWRCTFGRMLGHYGYLATRVGAFDRAARALDESYAQLADGRDPLGLTRTLLNQASHAFWTGDHAGARRLLDRCFELNATVGDRAVRSLGPTIASMCAHATGDYAEAEQLFRVALASWRDLGNPRGTVWCITACCVTLMALDKYAEAQRLLWESLALSHASRDSGGAAMTLHNLGRAALQQGDVEEAIYFLREALPSLRSASKFVTVYALNELGAALWQAGAHYEAGRAYAEALELSLEVHARHQAVIALLGLAAHHAAAGKHAAALRLAARALADPACPDEARPGAVELLQASRARLPADEAARLEEQAAALSLGAALAELGWPAPPR